MGSYDWLPYESKIIQGTSCDIYEIKIKNYFI